MARALRGWAINRGGKNSVRNLRYGPRTRLVKEVCTVELRFNEVAGDRPIICSLNGGFVISKTSI